MQQKHRHKLDALDSLDTPDPPTALLYQRYAPAIFAYLRQHTATREDAEDVLVEVFLAALENEKFADMGEKEQQAWLWQVARNKAVDAFRRSVRRQGVTLEHVADSLYDDDERTPEQAALRSEEYTHLHTHLQILSALQQEVLHLRFTNDLRCAEIAAHLGKREGTIRVLLSRTLNFLRGIYQQQTGNPRHVMVAQWQIYCLGNWPTRDRPCRIAGVDRFVSCKQQEEQVPMDHNDELAHHCDPSGLALLAVPLPAIPHHAGCTRYNTSNFEVQATFSHHGQCCAIAIG